MIPEKMDLVDLLRLQNLLSQKAACFINLPLEKNVQAVTDLLTLVGNGIRIDRISVYTYHFTSSLFTNNFEWCAPEVPSEIDNRRNISLLKYQELVKKHRNKETVSCIDVRTLEPDNPVRQFFEPRDILTFVTIPLIFRHECIGFICIESYKKINNWKEEEIDFFKLVAEILCNIMSRKKAEEELQKANLEIQSSNFARTQFLTNISHEIRTPLNAIIGMSRLLLETNIDPAQMKYMRNLRAASDNLLNIVNDILDFSKIETREIELTITSFNLPDLIRKIYDANEYKAEEKGIKLVSYLDPQIGKFYKGDQRRLQQILNNIVGNAIKFTSSGKVEISLELTGIKGKNDRICFSVKDTGIGISVENQEKVFNSFQQEDEMITKRFGGTGLGLTISRQLVEAMGGKLQLSSMKGEGSTFYFTIDLEPGLEPPPEEEAELSSSGKISLKGVKILVVEDNKYNQFIAQAILEKYSAKVSLSEDGLDAVNRLKSEKYDLILMDIQMPVMDGITATTIIRKELHLETPVIALTANVVREIVDSCNEAGMQGCLTKPYEEKDLIKSILELVGNSGESEADPESQMENEPGKETDEQIPRLVDLSGLIRMIGNNKNILRNQILKFIELTPDDVRQLQKAADNRDIDGIQKKSHQLKSSIGLIGNDILKNIILKINNIGKGGKETPELYPLINQFILYYQDLTIQLQNELDTL